MTRDVYDFFKKSQVNHRRRRVVRKRQHEQLARRARPHGRKRPRNHCHIWFLDALLFRRFLGATQKLRVKIAVGLSLAFEICETDAQARQMRILRFEICKTSFERGLGAVRDFLFDAGILDNAFDLFLHLPLDIGALRANSCQNRMPFVEARRQFSFTAGEARRLRTQCDENAR